jgi:ATP phosphoribosyltransferase regulatory subunit
MRLERSIPAEALDAIRAPLTAYSPTPIDVPVLQPLGLILDFAGEAMRSRLFAVSAGDGGEEACLRPDFTVAVARQHLETGAEAGRYYYDGKAFRVAPRGSDRAEEFLQIGIEAFEGSDPIVADAEIAAMTWRSASAGGRDDLSMVIGDISLFSAFVDSLALPNMLGARLKRAFAHPRLMKRELEGEDAQPLPAERSRLAFLLAGMHEDEAAEVLQELWALAGIEPVGGRRPAEIAMRLVERSQKALAGRLTHEQADRVRAYLAVNGAPFQALGEIRDLAGPHPRPLEHATAAWNARLDRMRKLEMPLDRMTLNAAFGRSFGYYDGFLFEVRSAALGEERPVAAGGRYDGLLARLGAETRTGAVGCMVRPARAYAGDGE